MTKRQLEEENKRLREALAEIVQVTEEENQKKIRAVYGTREMYAAMVGRMRAIAEMALMEK